MACSLVVDLGGYANGQGATVTSASDASAPDGGVESGVDASVRVVTALAANGEQTCAVILGTLRCWGNNASGQLGDGTVTNRVSPTPVVGLPPGEPSAVGVGEHHACAVVAGEVYCWGEGASGELGDGNKSPSRTPTHVTGIPAGTATRVCGGTAFSCAVAGGGVHCWGTNGVAQLGIGTAGSPVGTAGTVVTGSGPLANVTDVSCGQDHACAHTSTGQLVCWGHNDHGTLATSAVAVDSPSNVARPVEGMPGAAESVTIAGWHACGAANGAAYCWGRGDNGMLGNGQNNDSSSPVPVSGLASGVTLLVAAGGADDADATCALSGGKVSCWGFDQFGRLGDGKTAARATPVTVAGLPDDVDRISGGYHHFCVATASGSIWCWGAGSLGQLGDGSGKDSLSPVLVRLP